MAEIVYECAANAEHCEKAEFEEHPAEEPHCCGKPMTKTKDSCCDSTETSGGCC